MISFKLLQKVLIILALTLLTGELLAQEPEDEMSPTFRKNLQHIIQLEEQIERVQQDKDFSKEFDLRVQHIQDLIRLTFNNNLAYKLSVELEEFVNQHPELKETPTEVLRNQVMGMLLQDQFRHEDALLYFYQALESAKVHNWSSLYRQAIGHVVVALSDLDQDSLVLAHYHKSMAELNVSDWTKEEVDRCRYQLIQSLGAHYARNYRFDSALYYTRISLKETNTNEVLGARNRTMAWIFLESGRPDSSIFYGLKAVDMAIADSLKRQEYMAYDVIRVAYERVRDTANAFIYLNKFFQLKEEVASYDDALEISSLGLKKEKDKAALKQALVDQQLSNQRLIIWFVSAGVILLIVGLLYIISRLRIIRKQNVIIAQERDRAEQSERHKEQFLANMSHEIRTPIHAISGMLKILKRNAHPDFQEQFLDAMSKSTDNLSKLLNDVLDLSKITSGKLTIIYEPFDLRESVRLSVELLQGKAEEKGLSLELFFSEDLPKMVKGDALRLNQILINLINNAIKFSDQGKIAVLVKTENGGIRFSVSDEGPGISDGDQHRIFSSFEQAGSRQSTEGGTGLGLTITKKLIELQNGTLELTSGIGKGSVFSFTLPFQEFEGEHKERLVSEAELKSIGKKLKELKILLAEDTEFNVMVAKDELSWYFPESSVEVARDGKEALRMYGEADYDLVLMDVQMPNMDGYQSTQKIRELEVNNDTRKKPIIAMTASLLEKDIQKCLDSGMDDILPKPYRSDELVLKIAERVSK